MPDTTESIPTVPVGFGSAAPRGAGANGDHRSRAAYGQLIDRQLELARKAARWFRQSELFELAAPQVWPILNFGLRVREEDAPALHTQLVDQVTRDGQPWISATFVNGKSVPRVMIISYLTTEEHIAQLQGALEKATRALRPASALIAFLSQTLTLEPGDIISTGTPGGIGFYAKPPVFFCSGDAVKIEIEHTGILRNTVIRPEE